MGFIDTLKSRYELYRLEQRYTRRDKRTTFASGAVYVDGEYIYANGAALNPGEGAPQYSPNQSNPSSPAVTGTGAGFESRPARSGADSPSSNGPGSPMSASSEDNGRGPWGKLR